MGINLRKTAVLIILTHLLLAGGCKLGGIMPTATRANSAFAWGTEIHIPVTDENYLDSCVGINLPYEEHVTERDPGAGFLEGYIRTQNVGVECRFTKRTWSQGGGEERSYYYFSLGPEYHFNKFKADKNAIARAALAGLVYDERIKDSLGWRMTAGYTWAVWCFGFTIEATYHWAHTFSKIEGTSWGVPFRRTRPFELEWVSGFAGLTIAY